MLADVGAQALRGEFALVVALGVAIGGDGFERKFGVDDQGPVVRQKHAAIGPGAVRQRVLEGVGALGQAVLNDDFHARLAEGAARLLVGEHALQRGHLGGELGDVLLRVVDHREPLVELLQVLGRVQLGLFQRIAEPVRDRIEPLIDRVLQLRLAVADHADHGFEPRRGIGLRPRQFGHHRGLRIAGAGASATTARRARSAPGRRAPRRRSRRPRWRPGWSEPWAASARSSRSFVAELRPGTKSERSYPLTAEGAMEQAATMPYIDPALLHPLHRRDHGSPRHHQASRQTAAAEVGAGQTDRRRHQEAGR